MSEGAPIEDRLKANAQLVVSIAEKQLGTTIQYDEAGVRWLDGYIQRQHEQGDPANFRGLTNALGSFLGECIIHSFDGQWATTAGAWGVRFDDGNFAFPFAKVAKQLECGAEESVLSFFTMIPALFKKV